VSFVVVVRSHHNFSLLQTHFLHKKEQAQKAFLIITFKYYNHSPLPGIFGGHQLPKPRKA